MNKKIIIITLIISLVTSVTCFNADAGTRGFFRPDYGLTISESSDWGRVDHKFDDTGVIGLFSNKAEPSLDDYIVSIQAVPKTSLTASQIISRISQMKADELGAKALIKLGNTEVVEIGNSKIHGEAELFSFNYNGKPHINEFIVFKHADNYFLITYWGIQFADNAQSRFKSFREWLKTNVACYDPKPGELYPAATELPLAGR